MESEPEVEKVGGGKPGVKKVGGGKPGVEKVGEVSQEWRR